MKSFLIQTLLMPLPWALRRVLLQRLCGWRLAPSARIGLAWIGARTLTMGPGSAVGHLTVAKGLDVLELGAFATIGRANWITGYPSGAGRHFRHRADRRPELWLGEHAAVTNRHLIDCTDLVEIGPFTTFAGFRSQILTHSIDLVAGRQSCAPVRIGARCFVGTACTLLGGSRLPDRSVLGAMSLLNRAHERTDMLYAGVPAREIGPVESGARYFSRTVGYVD